MSAAGPSRSREGARRAVPVPFGSTARGTARPDSDLLIDHHPAEKFSLVDLAGITLSLEDRPGAAIDVATRDRLDPALRDHIVGSARKVF